MENCTNCSVDNPNLPAPGFSAFVIILLLLVVAAIVLDVTTITALCVAHSVIKLMRIFLINLLVPSVILSLIGGLYALYGLTLNFTSLPPDLKFCRFLVWAYSVGAVARLYSLAGFSIVVLLIVRYNKKEMKVLYIVLFLALIWCVSNLLNVHYLVTPIFPVMYYNGVACLPADPGIIMTYVSYTILVIFGGLTPLTISIVVPIVVLCYVRHNTMTGGSSYNKGMAKFALFLVAGNFINFVGQAVAVLIVYDPQPSRLYLSYLIVAISLIPTPIMTLIFVEPVRTQVTKVICCTRIRSICQMLKTSTTVD